MRATVAVIAASLLSSTETNSKVAAISILGDYLSLPQNDEDASRTGLISEAKQFWKNGVRIHQIQNMREAFPLGRGMNPKQDTSQDAVTDNIDSNLRSKYLGVVNEELHDLTTRGHDGILQGNIMDRFPQIDLSTFDDVANIYSTIDDLIEIPTTSKNWKNDTLFAQDRLTILGFAMERVKTKANIPPFPFSDVVQQITSTTMEQLVDQQRLYQIDLTLAGYYPRRRFDYETDGVNEDDPAYVPGVHALFFLDENYQLQPLAIRISETGIVYTPLDTLGDHWTFAKMALGAAEINYQIAEHFLITHLVIEPIMVEMHRHLSERHPVFALLQHHFKDLFGANVLNLKAMFQNGTMFDLAFGWHAEGAVEYMADRMRSYDWKMQSLPTRLRSRGLDNLMPNFKFGTDAMAIQHILRAFVKSFLKAYYREGTQDLRNDYELQSWLTALSDPDTGAGIRGFPTEVDSVGKLARIITDIIMTVTVMHTAMNSRALWHSSAFPLQTPALWHPLPTNKVVPIDLMLFMPRPRILWGTVAFLSNFYRPVSAEESLGASYATALIGDQPKVERARTMMLERLHDESEAIQSREEGSERPYTILDPENVPYFQWI